MVPLLFSVPMAAYHSGPLLMIEGTLAMVSTLLMTVGLPHSPEVDGIWWAHARHTALAFHRVDQGRFFTANKGAGADADIGLKS